MLLSKHFTEFIFHTSIWWIVSTATGDARNTPWFRKHFRILHIFYWSFYVYGVILSMSLKQFGKKLLTIHVPSMRHSSKHNSCYIIFRDCFRLNEKEIFQWKSLVIQFYWKLKSIFETSFEIYWSLKIKLSFKLKEIKKDIRTRHI